MRADDSRRGTLPSANVGPPERWQESAGPSTQAGETDDGLTLALEGLRGPLTAYCYRMLGSTHEADDAVQETMLRAWLSLDHLDRPDGLRPWSYKIATNVCLDALGARRRRALPMDQAAPSEGRGDLGSALPEATWIQPFPTGAVMGEDPVEQAVASESIRLAFVTALQYLVPRQRAVLILRDVLRWRASEVAELLESSVDAVHSILRRARRALSEVPSAGVARSGPVDAVLLDAYVEAFRRFDVDRIVALLHDDIVVSMPPFSFWLRGRVSFETFLRSSHQRCGHAELVVTHANGGPAVALYEHTPGGGLVASAIHVLEGRGGSVTAIHAFLEPGLLSRFGLPLYLDQPGQPGQLEEIDQRPAWVAESDVRAGPKGGQLKAG